MKSQKVDLIPRALFTSFLLLSSSVYQVIGKDKSLGTKQEDTIREVEFKFMNNAPVDTSKDFFRLPWKEAPGGRVPFDRVDRALLKDSILSSMQEMREEIALISESSKPADFDNTIRALENSGRALDRATRIYSIFTSTMSDEFIQNLEKELNPIIQAFSDEIVQNEELFAKVKSVYEKRQKAKLTPEQNRLIEIVYRKFARRGAELDSSQKKELAQLNGKLTTLYTEFRQNLLKEEESDYLLLENEEQLSGLSNEMKQAAASMAQSRGMEGKWLIANTRSSMEPFIASSACRELREKAWRIWTNRGANENERDNRKIISEILRLRSKRASLLGFPTHAHWALDDNMARKPEVALDLMKRVWDKALLRVRHEVEDMQRLALEEEGEEIEIAPWDYRYYSEKVRKSKYDIDQEELKQYLQLDKMLEGMFWAANKVFGIEMIKLDGIAVLHPDVSVYEVRKDGRQIGLWYFDPFARDGKSSGAWMSEYRTQERFEGTVLPIVSNNSNFIKGADGAPVLISWDDTTTMFHEFGHALHGLLSNVEYKSLAGTSVKRDFVEFPSQVFERWALTDEVLNRFAIHHRTGELLPASIITKLREARTFNQGFTTAEYLASAIYDMEIHLAATADSDIDPERFERDLMSSIKCPKEIVMRHRPGHFGHSFAGDGYSAGYYVYLWADTMSADAIEAFEEAGDYYDAETCSRFSSAIFEVGNSVPPEVAFRNFRGRDVDASALMRDRGFQ